MDILEEAKILWESENGMGDIGGRILLELIAEVERLRQKEGAEVIANYEKNQHLKIADAIDILTR